MLSGWDEVEVQPPKIPEGEDATRAVMRRVSVKVRVPNSHS